MLFQEGLVDLLDGLLLCQDVAAFRLYAVVVIVSVQSSRDDLQTMYNKGLTLS